MKREFSRGRGVTLADQNEGVLEWNAGRIEFALFAELLRTRVLCFCPSKNLTRAEKSHQISTCNIRPLWWGQHQVDGPYRGRMKVGTGNQPNVISCLWMEPVHGSLSPGSFTSYSAAVVVWVSALPPSSPDRADCRIIAEMDQAISSTHNGCTRQWRDTMLDFSVTQIDLAQILR